MIKSINYTNQFKKDLEKAKRQVRDCNTLANIIKLLAASTPLPYKFRDHKLIGNY
jgi:addiction module RelE/StbE family toxin